MVHTILFFMPLSSALKFEHSNFQHTCIIKQIRSPREEVVTNTLLPTTPFLSATGSLEQLL